MTRIIRGRTQAIIVKRPVETTGSLDQTTETIEEHREYIWLFRPSETTAQEIIGDELNGSLGGLAIADGTVDLQQNDRVTYGGVEYEIDGVVGHPKDEQADATPTDTFFWAIDFVRRQ